MIKPVLLTGLSYDYVVGHGSPVFIPGCTLVHALVMLGLLSADVHHQGSRIRPHDDVGFLVDVKVGSISGPGETEEATRSLSYRAQRNCFMLVW